MNHALRWVGDRAGAEDIVQDAFMRLHAHFAEVREPRPWLYRTVHNLALNHRRANDRFVPLDPPAEAEAEAPSPESSGLDPAPLPDEQIARMEGIGLVRLSLAGLDPRSREIVRLKFDEDLSYRDIGVRLGLSVGHVGYLLHHALKAIAEELAKAGVMPG